jgi:tetratricopeptide (TPR) repeat protein
MAVLAQVIHNDPPPPSAHVPGLDPALERICLRALAKRPADRIASMTDFAGELTEWLAGRSEEWGVRSTEKAPPHSSLPTPHSSPQAAPDPRATKEALRLLREWGWEQGLERLKRDMSAAADPSRRAALQILTGWLAGERGQDAEALTQLRAAGSWPSLTGWALAGEAFLAVRRKGYREAEELLARASAAADAQDTVLAATVAHIRGTLAHHEGRSDQALAELHRALEQLGPGHFSTGRVLDTLGMVHSGRNNFPFARAFYLHALKAKQDCGDDAGVALTHGQLGRLYLGWGRPDEADAQFRAGIDIARRTGDERGEAQLYNHRGQVQLARGRPVEAAALLDEAIRSARGRWSVVEGYALKDRALAQLLLGQADEAERASAAAATLFSAAEFAEGLTHVRRVRGLIQRRQGRHEESARSLRAAAAQFDQAEEVAEAADCSLELARTLRGQGAAPVLAVEALQAALDRAEASRRPALVAAVEREFREAAPLELAEREVRRLRGAAATERAEETASVLCLELRTDATAAEGPSASLETRNHLFADLAPLLAGEGVEVSQYRGDGFLALVRGQGHAVRAVKAVLAVLDLLREVNRPARVLGWPPWRVHAAVATGVVCVGAVGTFAKRDYTAVGEPVRLATRLLAEARPDLPCLDDATREATASLVSFDPSSPQTLSSRDGPRRVWEVAGRLKG